VSYFFGERGQIALIKLARDGLALRSTTPLIRFAALTAS
jgi:hypothetical protein